MKSSWQIVILKLFLIAIGVLSILFFVTADYSRNTVSVAGFRWFGSSYGSWDGRSQYVSPLFLGIMFLVGSLNLFVLLFRSTHNRREVSWGLLLSGLMFLGFLVLVFRYFSSASLFDLL